jgi:hypothetical protein
MERNKNIIKAEALEKLDSIVELELKSLEENGMSINDFSLDHMLQDLFSEEEDKEVLNSIEQIRAGRVDFYCKCRGIDIPDKLKK